MIFATVEFPSRAGPTGVALPGLRALLAVVLAAGGCTRPRADVELYQPSEAGFQQRMRLTSEVVSYATGGDGAARLLLEWPLPGSRLGPKQYALYLRLPPGAGTFAIGDPIADHGIVGGFLIQRTGRLKGLTRIGAGRVTVSGSKMPTGKIELKCADGTEIRGPYRADPSGHSVAAFERAHRADIAGAK